MGRIGGGRAPAAQAIPAVMAAVQDQMRQRTEPERDERRPTEAVDTRLADEPVCQPCAEGGESEDIRDTS